MANRRQREKQKALEADRNKAILAARAAEAPPWAFYCAKDSRGNEVIDDWSKRLSKTAQANLDRALDHLRSQPKDRWSRPQASPLKDHIYVIRFKDESGAQLRLFGYFVPGTNKFVLSLTGSEKDGKYQPADYLERTKAVRAFVDENFLGRSHRCFEPE